MASEEADELVASLTQLVLRQRGQRRPGGEPLVDALDLLCPGVGVVGGEGDVAALERAAGVEGGSVAVGGVASLLAEGLRVVVDAGDVGTGINE
ncbi:hypothetical protein ACIRVF_39720 [Kitasatospora sp. NPDC101157]|uniref:hypothetical protein n=1 Tax=Kitasatospora sp. NPDC101157 TaxID=3364098 RepID=UPI0038151505